MSSFVSFVASTACARVGVRLTLVGHAALAVVSDQRSDVDGAVSVTAKCSIAESAVLP